MSETLKQSLHLQWKLARWPLVPFVIVAFALPFAALVQSARAGQNAPMAGGADAILVMQQWVVIFPFVAALTGLLVGLMAWAWDHRANHVYALSLPVSRTRYTLVKLAASGIVLLIPVVAAWVGALAGSAFVDVAEPLREYPNAFALRFLLAAAIAYVATFALAAGTMRTAIYLLIGFVFFLVVGGVLVTLVEQLTGAEHLWTPSELLFTALGTWPGPFHVFGGNWMLIDV